MIPGQSTFEPLKQHVPRVQRSIAADTQLTAVQGEVCVLVGEICCMYIPDNDTDGQAIQQGIDNMTALRDRMMEDEVDATKYCFFNLLSGWKKTLLRILLPAGMAIILIFTFLCCGIPVIRTCISRTTQGQYIQWEQ